MINEQNKEKRNNRIGVLTSVGIHAVLFLALFFLVAWRAPDPPLPEFGIELNFGLDSQGSGDEQPETPVGEETIKPDDAVEQSAEAQPQEPQPEIKEQVKETVAEKAVEQAVSKEESPVVVKEEKKEVKSETKKEKVVESTPKEKVIAEYKKDDTKESTAKDASKKGTPGNQGDDTNKVGDKGSPEGTLDAKALYGTPGGGGGGNGMSLEMSGWMWADKPQVPDLPDNENGKVIFEIECDENGDITAIKTIERSLSPASENLLKKEIQKNSLVRTSSNATPGRSKGRIVFILKTK